MNVHIHCVSYRFEPSYHNYYAIQAHQLFPLLLLCYEHSNCTDMYMLAEGILYVYIASTYMCMFLFMLICCVFVCLGCFFVILGY